MRLDRIATLGVIYPAHRMMERVGLCSSSPVGQVDRLVILMYHSISDDLELGCAPYYRVCTTPKLFADQMQWLAELGCSVVTMSEALRVLRKEPLTQIQNPPDGGRTYVVITFDDGFRDFYATAYPILLRHNFLATMYLPTSFIRNERQSFKSRDCLTWNEVRELHRAGIEFGSHTVTHPRLVQLQWPAIERELVDSRAVIEQEIGAPIRSFAYPYAYPQAEAEFTRRIHRLLEASGYESSVTTMVGTASLPFDRLALPRLPVNSADDRPLFIAKLSGCYDWLALPQLLFKGFIRWFSPASRPIALKTPSTA